MMKFTEYEAKGIQPLVANSPLMGWTYHFLSVRQFSDGPGVVEVGTAILIALRALSPKTCAIGSVVAALISHHALIPAFNSRMGTESRWFSCTFGPCGAVSLERRGPARGGSLVIGRGIITSPRCNPCLGVPAHDYSELPTRTHKWAIAFWPSWFARSTRTM